MSANADLYSCALCGYSFEPSALVCHTSCPLSAGCHLTCCPNCGYHTPDESRMMVAGTLKRTWEAYLQKRSAGRKNIETEEMRS